MDVNEIATKADIAELTEKIVSLISNSFKARHDDNYIMQLKEAAQYLRCNANELRIKALKGEIPYIRDSRRYKFTKKDLDDYILSYRVQDNTEAVNNFAIRSLFGHDKSKSPGNKKAPKPVK